MPVLFVRHAVALRRSEWAKDDSLRPLTPRGYSQADALAENLAEFAPERILSSPAVRCIETVQPLAARFGLPVESIPFLGEGYGTAALPLLIDVDEMNVVLCTHGDVLPELLLAFAPNAATSVSGFPCEKGSTWVVEDGGAQARYLRPPA
jgi:8-oxo-dGTP diphosphatase